MTSPEDRTIRGGDKILARIETWLKCASALLIIPAALASQAQFPYWRLAVAPMLVSLALWFLVIVVIAVGQRLGFVDAQLSASTVSAGDEPFVAPRRPTPPIVRETEEALPAAGAAVVRGGSVRVAHVPGRGDVRYRIGSA